MAIGGGMKLFDTVSIGIYEWSNHVNELVSITSGLPLRFIDGVLDYHSPLVEKMFEIHDSFQDALQAVGSSFGPF